MQTSGSSAEAWRNEKWIKMSDDVMDGMARYQIRLFAVGKGGLTAGKRERKATQGNN